MVHQNPSEWSLPHRYGKYELLDRIGEGGMAEVYRARLIGAAGFEKIVVIKRILPHLARRADFVRMFVNEAKLAAQIQHKNVVQVFELGQLDNGELYIAMEFVQGIDLRGILRNAAERRFRIPIWFTLHTVAEVLAGLTHAHEFRDGQGQASPVIHRDITPANVFISVNGEVKLADFGIAKAVGDSNGTEAGQVKGNVSYMSPEALLGEPLDSRADVFAAGVVLWELLTQHRLFQGRSNFETARAICDAKREPPSRFNWKVTPELDSLCLLTLGAERQIRLGSAREFQARLVGILSKIRPNLLPGQVKNVVEVILGRKPLDPRVDPELGAEMLDLSPSASGSYDLPRDPLGWLPPDLGAALDKALPPIPGLDPSWPTGPLPMMGVAPIGPVTPASVPLMLQQAPTTGPIKTIAGEKLKSRDTASRIPHPTQPHSPATGSFPPPARISQPSPAPVESRADEVVPLASLEEFMPWDARSGTTDSLPPSGVELQKSSKGVSPAAGGFYIRYDDGNVVGPANYDELLKLCDGRAVGVSADRVRWQGISTFARLSGLDRLARDDAPLRKVTMVGRLEDRSLVSVFAQLAHTHATGRLVIMDTGGNSTARREVDVLKGAPAFVFADHPSLQLPNLLVSQNVITKEQSGELVRQVLVRGSPLLDLISFQAFTDVNRVWPLLMKDRLVEVFKWRVGKLAFDAGAEVKSNTPFARSLNSVLFDCVYRGYTRDELSRLLEGVMNSRLNKNEHGDAVLKDMALSSKQSAMAEKLQNKSLSSIIKKLPAQEAHVYMVLAFVLLESEVLVADGD